MPESIFTKIINREVPAKIQYEDDDFIAFDDIKPSAPFDILIVLKEPYATLQDVPLEKTAAYAGLLKTARKVAEKVGISDNYRIVMNVGQDMQLVKHVHLHLMGGWPTEQLHQVKLKNI